MQVHVSLAGRSDLSGEIYRQLRRAITEGRLLPGEALPPTREMAHSLRVSRTTVAVAYERLLGEGFVTSKVGAGTFVSADVPVAQPARPPRRPEGVLRARDVWSTVRPSVAFARPAEFDFRSGLPDVSLFPFEKWRRLMADELRAEAAGHGIYGLPAGYHRLREAIARYISVSRGVQALAEDVVITNGTQQALDVIARTLIDPGETIAVEDPGYHPARMLFASLGANVRGVPVDNQGLVVDALPSQARLVYVSPSHQYPLGMSMSLGRRLALLAWAEAHDAAIIEDDYDSEFRYGGRPIEPLQTLDSSGRVIYAGSFSKTMLPTLRLGFIVAPPGLSTALRAAKYVADWHTSMPPQAALANFIEDGSFARHIRKMRLVYEKRHDLVRGLLARDFAGVLDLVPSGAGLHVSAFARNLAPSDSAGIIERAYAAGVAVQDLSVFYEDLPPRAGIILGYGAIATDRIPEGLQRLRACFET